MDEYLSISQMAEMHGITRQTLIHYDHAGVFKPVMVGENGYRYYNVYQIPYLREIVLLRKLGMRLEDIKENMETRNLGNVLQLFEKQQFELQEKILQLQRYHEYIQARITFLRQAQFQIEMLDKPFLAEFQERMAVFTPLNEPPSRSSLHLNIAKEWNSLYKNGLFPSGFGTLFRKEELHTDNLFKGAGVFTMVTDIGEALENEIRLPSGIYACMWKYGMPYDDKALRVVMRWIGENQYQIAGDAIDICILDTTFYSREQQEDLCCIQIPVITNFY